MNTVTTNLKSAFFITSVPSIVISVVTLLKKLSDPVLASVSSGTLSVYNRAYPPWFYFTISATAVPIKRVSIVTLLSRLLMHAITTGMHFTCVEVVFPLLASRSWSNLTLSATICFISISVITDPVRTDVFKL